MHPTQGVDLRLTTHQDAKMRIDSLLAETVRLVRAGYPEAAANLLEKHLVSEPDCISALQSLARIRRSQHRPADAVLFLKRVLALQVSERTAGVAGRIEAASASATLPSDSASDAETLDLKDWNWLRANDLEIRTQRRSFDGDIAPMAEAGREPRGDGAPTYQQPDRSVDHRDAETKAPTASSDELHATELHGSPREKHIAGARALSVDHDDFGANEQDDFLPLVAWNEPDQEDDRAQLHFETQLESSAEEKQAIPTPEQEYAFLDDASNDLFEVVAVDTEAERTAFDWTDFASDADEFDDAPTREDLEQAVRTTGQVSRRQRARQQAIEVGQEFGWDTRGIELLTDVFTAHFWSSAKRSMQRELANGLTADEFEIAIQVREFWRERTEFSIDLSRTPLWAANVCGVSSAVYHVLSWPAAIRLIRLTNALPDAIEIERLLDDLYMEWYSNERLRYHYPSFHYYLYRWLDCVADRSDLVSTWGATIDASLKADPDGVDENSDPGHTTP